jgi:predicted Fe-Mo cluster-binding NifX family protein
MAFVERMKELLDQGVAVSKEFAVKAGAKAQDIGERGVMMLEISQLEGQAQKLIGRLGTEAYQTFTERGEQALSAESDTVKSILSEIAAARKSIEQKETELKSRKGK